MTLGFLKIESYKKGIALSSGFNLVSKLLVFLQSVAIAYYFGTHATTDVYFYCFATITLFAVFINSLDSSVLIPESMRLKEHEGQEASSLFLNFFIFLYLMAGAVFTLLLYAYPVNAFLAISNFDRSILEKNQEIITLSIPLLTLMIITNLLVNILTSYKFFTVPMVVGVINGVLVLAFLFVFHSSLQVQSVLLGYITAYLCNLALLVYLMKKNLQWKFNFKAVTIRKATLNNIFYAQAGNISSTFASFIPVYLLSGFNPGIITALTFGQRTAEMPNQLITTQSSSVIGIKLNELYARKEFTDLSRIFITSAEVLLFILTPLSFILFLYNEIVIEVLFMRGAFNAQSVAVSADFFKYFVLLLPMLAINTLVARLFMAGQKIKGAFVYQICFNFVLAALIFANIRLIGITGYPIALLVLHSVNVLATYFLLRWFFPSVEYGRLLVRLFKIAGLNLIVFLPSIFLKNLLADVPGILAFTVGSVAYMLPLLLINWLLNVSSEVNHIARKAIRYLRSNRSCGSSERSS